MVFHTGKPKSLEYMNQIDVNIILSLGGLHYLAVMAPGPDFVLVSKNALTHSQKMGVFTALGIGLGILIHISYSLAGLGQLIIHAPKVFRVIQILGGIYLLWIALQSFRSKESKESLNFEKREKELTFLKAMRMGFVTNILNPKVGLFFVSIFSQFINEQTPIPTKAIVGLEIFFLTVFHFTLVSYGIGHRLIKERYLRYETYIDRLFALILFALGLKIMWG